MCKVNLKSNRINLDANSLIAGETLLRVVPFRYLQICNGSEFIVSCLMSEKLANNLSKFNKKPLSWYVNL